MPIPRRTIRAIAFDVTGTNRAAKLQQCEDLGCENVNWVAIASSTFDLLIHFEPFVDLIPKPRRPNSGFCRTGSRRFATDCFALRKGAEMTVHRGPIVNAGHV